jgi:hypothetical protein
MARVSKVAAGVAARKGKAEKKIRTTNWWLFKWLFKIIFYKKSKHFKQQTYINLSLIFYTN